MLCMARWLADYANPTKREFTSPIATILIETIKRWRENVKKGVKNKFVCLGFMRSGMKRFLMWRSIHFFLIWMVWTPIILGLNTSIKFWLHCCLKEQKVTTHGKTREAVFIWLNVQKICKMQRLYREQKGAKVYNKQSEKRTFTGYLMRILMKSCKNFFYFKNINHKLVIFCPNKNRWYLDIRT